MRLDWLLSPESLTWKMTQERALLVGGGRALMLQACHPLVGAGVHQHSAFQKDPWTRLRRTSDFYLGLVYAKQSDLPSLNRWLEHAHRGVKGTAEDGREYQADQPDLMLWVQATLADSVAWAYCQIWGPLPEHKMDRYWQEQKILGEAIQIDMSALPDTWQGFQEWMDQQYQNLQITPAAEAAMEHLQNLPIALPGIPLAAWKIGLPLSKKVSRQAVLAGLPENLRVELDIPWTPAEQEQWQQTCQRLSLLLKIIPSPLRHSQHARRAMRQHQIS